MARKVKSQKPRIPEPSPRFILWSMVVGFLLIAAAIGYDYVTGSADFAAAPTAQAQDIRPR
jgi:hypothetical protein